MRIRLFILFGFLSIPTVGYSQSASSAFSLADKSAISTITNGSGVKGGTDVGYARIITTSGTTPSGVAIFGYKPAGVLVSEAGVPASPLIKNGRIYAEVGLGGNSGQGTDIGLVVTNPNNQDATISFTFTDTTGTDVRTGNYVLKAQQQKGGFLDQDPWNSALGFQGTFSFNSNVGVSVVALQGYRNERIPSDFLITTLPVIDLDNTATSTSSALLPYYTDGDGWSTNILLVNPTHTPLRGKIQFRNAAGAAQNLTANGQLGASFNYTIKPNSSFKLTTAGTSATGPSPNTGPVTITPDPGSSTPVPLVVFSFSAGGITLTQAGVPANLANTFRMYVEATPGTPAGVVGSYSSGFAIANSGTSQITVNLELTSSVDASVTTAALIVPGAGVAANFLENLFPTVTLPFQGVLRIASTSSAISVVGLRIRYNERSNFLMTTTPPTNEATAAMPTELDFPYIVNGGGFTTQFILFSGTYAQTASGNLQFSSYDGTALALTINSLMTGPPVLTSISPPRVAVGSSVNMIGTGFSANNAVVFTTGSGTVDVAPSAATSNTLAASVPANAITGPLFVRNGSQTSASQILEVMAQSGAPLQTSITIGASTTVTGGDIYVPPPAAGLSVTGIGVGDPGTLISYAPATATIARGGNKQLLLSGSGFSDSTSVAVSGTGISLSNFLLQNGMIFMNISVASTAATGTRNVIVTNSNGDISILTGGLLIQ